MGVLDVSEPMLQTSVMSLLMFMVCVCEACRAGSGSRDGGRRRRCARPARRERQRLTGAPGFNSDGRTQGRRASCRNYSGLAAQSIFPPDAENSSGRGGCARREERGERRRPQGGRRSAAGRCNARRRPGRRADSRTATPLRVGDHATARTTRSPHSDM